MAPSDGTITCHLYCTAFIHDNTTPLTVTFTAVSATDSPTDAIEGVFSTMSMPFLDVQCPLAGRGFYTERVG